eukprot:TRINITY_DN14981_c0_g7_i2.p1 TRINITY_DN14981_c0_g7~~TRINITY_DN14981_c0_g7_i2.p1  ORF type:complete len:1607 (+),score=422.79 TRINITY_DN14981_c0_g7_i2:61-4881(+)
MGKKPAAKKKGKMVDMRGYSTCSVPSKAATEEAVAEAAAAAAAAPGADGAEDATAPAADAAGGAPAAQGSTAAGDAETDEEEWERAAEAIDEAVKAREAAARAAAEASSRSGAGRGPTVADDTADMDEEEFQKLVERRMDEELEKVLSHRMVPMDHSAQFERKSTFSPAGVAMLTPAAEKRVESAMEAIREELPSGAGSSSLVFPRHWRYKGKITYERLNGIYLGLESLQFKGVHIRDAMSKTFGYDARAPLEYLLATLPREELPRQFGGEALSDAAAADAAAAAEAAAAVEAAMPSEQPPKAASASGSGKKRTSKPDSKAAEAAAAADEVADAADGGSDSGDSADGGPSKDGEEQGATAPTTAKSESADKDFNKAWAARYCAGGDSDSDGLLDEDEKIDRERRKDPTARYIGIAKECDELIKMLKVMKDRDRRRKGGFNRASELEKQKVASTKIAKIKAEIEELDSGKYGKLDRDRIAQARPPAPTPEEKAAEAAKKKAAAEARAAEAKAKAEAAAAEDQEDGPELPSLFDGDDAAIEALAPTEGPPPCRVYNISNWTGKTPKSAFEEYARKKIWGKSPPDKVATYEKNLPQSRPGRFYARVTVPFPRNKPSQSFLTEEPCETVRDAENLAAMFALYKLSEEHERADLVRNLPPAFRQRIKEWVEEAEARFRAARREVVRSRVSFISSLHRTPPPLANLGTSNLAGAAGTADAARRNGNAWTDLGNGDDEEEFSDLSTEAAEKLRRDFEKRRESLAEDEAFQEIQQARAKLPVAEWRDRLVRSIRCSGVVVVSGATGSGKTTQVPQFVLEDALERSDASEPLPNIIVTEPRRISAVSVAQRVSDEMGDRGGPGSRGSLVGYQIRLEKKVSDSTRLLFCTVGVLLKKMQQNLELFSKVTHIFIDEVHERSADCDLLMLLLRHIRLSKPDLRVVLMSATLEVKKLVRYFGNNVPVVDVPGRTFPVEAYWLEDIVEMTGYECGEESEFAKRGWGRDWSQRKTFEVSGKNGNTEKITAYIDNDDDEVDDEAETCDPGRYHRETCKTLARMDHTKINYTLLVGLLEYIEGSEHFNAYPRDDGAILVFLSGLGEISKTHEAIMRSPVLNDPKKFLIISLHSVLSGDDQSRAFKKPPRGMRKIVLSTNIAETGVTIPDVVFVIDAAKVKCQQYHEPSNTSSLKEKFVSRAEILQRRGRAGRVREGFCFHLVTKRRVELRLQELPTPEILRCSLMELMLSVLSSGLQPSCFLELLDPPARTRIDQAVATLRAVGAVEEGSKPANALQIGRPDDDVWYVPTPIGGCLARLPCDVRLGKMALLSALFGGSDAVVTVAATLSHRSPLATPFSEAKRAEAKHVHCAELLSKDGPPSDHLALNVAYNKWEEAKKGKGVDSFCRKAWLNGQCLQTIRDIKNDLHETLRGEGFCVSFEKEEADPKEIRSALTVSALLFAGLYPNVARTDPPKNATDKSPLIFAGNEQLKLHPGSLCAGKTEGLHKTNYRWICYHTKLKTTQVYLRDCTFLTPNALLLFAGDTAALNVHPVEKSVSIGLGAERHWNCFHCAPRTAALLRQLRYAFDAVLRRKASHPRRPLSRADRLVIAAYIAVMNSLDTS